MKEQLMGLEMRIHLQELERQMELEAIEILTQELEMKMEREMQIHRLEPEK